MKHRLYDNKKRENQRTKRRFFSYLTFHERRKQLRALPQDYCQIAGKEQVKHILRLKGHFKAESLSNDDMPESTKLLVHRLLYQLGRLL